MSQKLDKSLSETELSKFPATPPSSFSSGPLKRPREDDFTTALNNCKDDMLNMINKRFAIQDQELKKIAPTLKDLHDTYLSIKTSLSYLADQNEELKKKMESLENQTKEDRKYITLLEDKIEDLQMGSRKSNFELKNVPKKNNETKEDLIEMVVCMAKNVNATLSKSDIKDIYRVRGKKEGIKNTPIIVETSSTIVKADILKSCKMFNTRQKAKLCAKHLGLRTDEDTPVYISEHLTIKQARLHFLARDLVRNKKYKFCWTAYGKVYLRKDENSKIELVKTESQIHNLISRST